MTLLDGDKGAQGGQGEGGQGAAGGQGDGSAQGGSWIDSLPEAIRGDESLKTFKDPGELASAYLEARAKLPVVPEAPDKYDLAMPADAQADEQFISWYRETAHKLGLTNEQAKQLAGEYQALYKTQTERLTQEVEAEEQQWVESLKTEWGGDFDKNVAAANRSVRFLESRVPGFVKWLNGTGNGNDPHMVKTMLALSSLVSEDMLHEGDAAGSGGQGEKSVAKRMYPNLA